MKVTIPSYLLGKPIEGSLERALAGTTDPNHNPLSSQILPTVASNPGFLNLQEYIMLPSTTHGTYSYPDFLVAKHRLGYDTHVERAAKELG